MLARRKPLRSLVFLLLGAGSAIIGFLPWAITGMRLPLQNLWAVETSSADMPITLLPFSQYYLSLIVALIVIGSTIAGIVGRATAAKHPRSALVALMGGVVAVQVIATVQTAVTVSSGLRDSAASTVYLAALVAGTVAAILLGMGMLALIARAPKAGALIAVSIASIAFSSWLGGLVFPVGVVVTASPLTSVLGEVAHLAPAVVIGVAIAWAGVDTVGRVIAAIASLAILWVGPTLVTAVSAAAGSRVLARYPSEMLDYGVGVFRMALGMPEIWLTTLALAVAVSFVGLVARRVISQRRVAATV
ncbi:MAG: hypothetical protein JWP85_597 [Rhodoglobus sp.]|nr:hypothetical protein [Rhodoglobus sp.]